MRKAAYLVLLAMLCASCSTSQPQLETFQELAIQQKLEDEWRAKHDKYKSALARAADELEPSGASPSEIAVAAHQKSLAEFNAYMRASINWLVTKMKHRNFPQYAIEDAKREMYAEFKTQRKLGEDFVVQRVIEIRAKAITSEKTKQADAELEAAVDAITALNRLAEAKGAAYIDAVLRAAVLLEPSGASPAEIAEAALAKCQPELIAARKADADLFSWFRQQSSKGHTSNAWEHRMKENEQLYIDAGTSAVIKWVTGVRNSANRTRPHP
jgi:hypothetical protein